MGADAEPPVRRQRPDARQVAVELGGEEAGPAHLAVADHVDPGPLLVVDREVDAVVEQLREVRGAVLAALGGRDRVGEPAGVGVRPDDARQQRLVAHGRTSVNANARAGLSTKRRSADRGVETARVHRVAELAQQVVEAGRATERPVVALAGGVHPQHHAGRGGRPPRPTRAAGGCRSGGRPSGTPGRRRRTRRSRRSRGGRPRSTTLSTWLSETCAAGDPGVGQDPELLERARAALAVGVDRDAGPPVGEGGAAEDRQVARRRAAVAPGDLDHAGAVVGPPDDRPAAVVRVDPVLDVGDEQVGELVLGRGQAPVRGTVEPLVVQPGRGDEVDAGPARQLGELRRVPARSRSASCRPPSAARPRAASASSCASRSTSARRKSGDSSTGRPPSMTRCSWAYVTPIAAGSMSPRTVRTNGHGRGSADGSGETDAIDQPPSTFSSWPVTARDSSDRKYTAAWATSSGSISSPASGCLRAP